MRNFKYFTFLSITISSKAFAKKKGSEYYLNGKKSTVFTLISKKKFKAVFQKNLIFNNCFRRMD